MPFPVNFFLPFRLKLLAAMLTAAGAGIYFSYSGFRGALEPYSEGEAGERLLSRIEVSAARIDEEVNSGLEYTRFTASRAGLLELLKRHNLNTALPSDAADLAARLADASGPGSGITRIDLAGADGKVAASADKSRASLNLSAVPDFRLTAKKAYISPPRAELGNIFYEITVPVQPPAGDNPRLLGALRCRFSLRSAAAGPEKLAHGGFTLALAKKSGQHLVVRDGTAPAREISLKAQEGAPFLPALSGKEGLSSLEESSAGRMIYAWREIPGPGWIIAAKIRSLPGSLKTDKLLERARLSGLMVFLLLAVAAFFCAGNLAAPLCEAGRQAAELLEQCGNPPVEGKRLCEPRLLARAIEEAASTMKNHTSRDIALETETEKLREEEADLKSQNEELEKLNKYLMEREIKISELKKEIDDLREKVGGGTQD